MRSKHYIASLGVGALLAVSSHAAHAQSRVELYGQVDAWAGSQRLLGNSGAWVIGGGGMSTSYWGLRGSEDLGGEWRATFGLEAFFRPQNGRSGSFDGEPFFGRNAYVGIGGPYGSIDLGRLVTPYFVTTVIFNPFVDSYTFSPMVLHTYVGVDNQGLVGGYAWNNAVVYHSPKVRGLTADVIYALGNQPGDGNAHKWGGALNYTIGPFAASVAYQSQPFDTVPGDLDIVTPGFSRQTALQVAASWDFNGIRLYGQYQRIADRITMGDLTTNGGQVGISLPLDGGNVLASFVHSKTSGGNGVSRNTLAAGYDYNLSRRTDVYTAILADRATGMSSGLTYGVGIRSRF
ncbi:porin [Paraburkholderia sp. CNPSo 3157]|uniref:Porin n=1 Tax=Paraburkholderia franconis TaxID=2654983 RepID=A0A7X1TK50_9BURK|nr:porin [Paraburkholderia franconis]MPW22260.1 porin [Paraburkholderia franconis]